MRTTALLLVAFLFSNACLSSVSAAESPALSPPATITGRVLDASSGIPVPGVAVESIGPTDETTTTDASGSFSLSKLTQGLYQLRLSAPGRQTTLSDDVTLIGGSSANVTLAITQQEIGTESMRTIARTTTHASQSLQRSSVIYRQQSAESIERDGIFRVGDFLRTLPQVNVNAATGGSDTPSPGDDVYLDIRGIGGMETLALFDGHPIGWGINRGKNIGYNWEVSPTFALRSVQVTYGSGVEGLTPYSAVGGTVDMQTLEPTPTMETNLTQGWGTFDKLATTVNSTGTIGRFGYAAAVGSQGIDGPYKNQNFFQPSAAFDPSAPAGTPEHDSGIYPDDTSVTNRGMFGKLRYTFGSDMQAPQLTLSAMSAAYWDNKTGNGDQDFLPYDTALALGNSALGNYKGPCSGGQFTPSNANGAPWGTGINGQPDGGKSCVTPGQYAQIAGGLQGAGTTWQSFNIADYSLKYDQQTGAGRAGIDLYTNRFNQIYDRTYQEPFFAQPGDNAYWLQPQVTTTGGNVTDLFQGLNNDFGLGFATNNYAYLFNQNGVEQPSPIVHDNTWYLEDVVHPASARYTAYFNAADAYSTVTHTNAFNPRLAVVWELPHNNVVRVASGVTTIQPYPTYISLPFSPIATGALNGNLNCTGLTSIGQVSNPGLQPERAIDEEVSVGHRFGFDSLMQLTLYNENVNNKIYSTVIPATSAGSAIPGSTLTNFETAINNDCGTTGINGVGVNSQANVGRLLARGLDLTGRVRFTHKFFVDYDYSVESSALQSADATTLQNNLTLIIGSQLPGVPLHKGQIAFDGIFGKNIDVRLTQNFVSANNSKNSPGYNWGDLSINVPVTQNGSFNIAVSNVFSQDTQYDGLIGHGVPVALNQYATPNNYIPLIGAAATELYGIPYRQIFFSYTQHLH